MPTEILVQSLIFNEGLHKQGVKIVGTDSEGRSYDGVFLVKAVEPKKISVVSYLNENYTIGVECLCTVENPTGLVLTVL